MAPSESRTIQRGPNPGYCTTSRFSGIASNTLAAGQQDARAGHPSGVALARASAAAQRRLVQLAACRETLLLGIEVGPCPGEALVAAVVGAGAVGRLPGPQADALAADLARITPQAQFLAAIHVEVVHRAGVGEQRRAMVRHRRGDPHERLLCLQDQAALAAIRIGVGLVVVRVIVIILLVVAVVGGVASLIFPGVSLMTTAGHHIR